MSNGSASPLETLLDVVASTAPEPWYPREYAERSDSDPNALSDVLEMAFLEKLIERTVTGTERGPGFVLTELGERVRLDPESLQRLREGLPLVEGDPGAIVRSSLRQPFKPLASKVVLFANLLVFGYGISLVWHNAALMQTYVVGLSGGADFIRVLHQIGSVEARDVLKGEWWRLLTTCFVHAGLLHLGMNMYMLYNIGSFVEQTWGRWRFAVIYALSGWGGSCLAVAYTPNVPMVGASGALCGIFGAQAIWVALYARYLPRAMARRGISQTLFNIVLLVGISLIPGVSGYAHLGGALAGAATALVLHFQRFGPPALPALRWAALALLVPVAWGSFAILDRARANSPEWKKAVDRLARQGGREELPEKANEEKERKKGPGERKRGPKKEDQAAREYREFRNQFLTNKGETSVKGVAAAASEVYEEQVGPLVQKHAERREPEDVKKALAVLPTHQRKVAKLASALAKAGPYKDEATEEARTTARDYAKSLAELLATSERSLREGKKFPRKDAVALEKLAKKVNDERKRWEDLVAP